MRISTAGLDLIKEFEGYHKRLPDGGCAAYQCPAGVWTIGWGCTEGVTPGMVWSSAEATMALRREVAKHEAAVQRLVTVPITQAQFDALVSFSYNCGSAALARSTLLARLNAGDTAGAAAAFGMWTKGGGRVLPGLVRRRQREAELFLSDSPPAASAEPSMPQAVEADRPPPAPLTRSGTIWGTVGTAAAAVLAYVDETVSTLIEAAAKLQELAPAQGMLATVAGNTRSLALSLTVGCVVLVIGRRVRAKTEGKPG